MLVAILALFGLYLSKTSKENSHRNTLVKKNRINGNSGTSSDGRGKRTREAKSGCPHSFGFLGTRGQKGVPEECQGCDKLVECLVGK
jgi:hypothetical protein